MGEFLKDLLPWKLRILTSHLELPSGATPFWGFFQFEPQYRPTSLRFKRFQICFTTNNELLFLFFNCCLSVRVDNYTIIFPTKCTSLLKAQDITICTFLSLYS
jgi:hypothetical protein